MADVDNSAWHTRTDESGVLVHESMLFCLYGSSGTQWSAQQAAARKVDHHHRCSVRVVALAVAKMSRLF